MCKEKTPLGKEFRISEMVERNTKNLQPVWLFTEHYWRPEAPL
jgi:hypothetical protein